MIPDFVIALPAWGRSYVDLCTRFTIPALKAALARASRIRERNVRFIVHTDDPDRMAEALFEFEVHFYRVPPHPKPFHAFSIAHREAIQATPLGAVLMMMNADIVPSVESIEFAERRFAEGKKAIVSVAMRCDATSAAIPIGRPARDLLEFFWRNRHPIAEDSIWGTGRTMLPTNLFFVGDGSVVLHCFHLYPVLLIKDRALGFSVTIDDDLLRAYQPHEWTIAANREVAFLELSPPAKQFNRGPVLTVPNFMALGRSFTPFHVDLFRTPIRILGESDVPIAREVVAQISAGCLDLYRRRGRTIGFRPWQPRPPR